MTYAFPLTAERPHPLSVPLYETTPVGLSAVAGNDDTRSARSAP